MALFWLARRRKGFLKEKLNWMESSLKGDGKGNGEEGQLGKSLFSAFTSETGR